jgi:hypothetical protein
MATNTELRNKIAECLWNEDIRYTAEREGRSPNLYAQWPEDFEKQPYCRSTLAQAQAVTDLLDAERAGQEPPPGTLDYRAMWDDLRTRIGTFANFRYRNGAREFPSNVLDEVRRLMTQLMVSASQGLLDSQIKQRAHIERKGDRRVADNRCAANHTDSHRYYYSTGKERSTKWGTSS